MKKNLILKSNKPAVRRAVLAAICCVCVLSISACGKKDNRNENRDPITGADQSQTTESSSENNGSEGSSEDGSGNAEGDHSEFDAMIGDENTDPNNIINYINTNIAGAAVNDVRRFFTGLLSFGDDIRNINFTGLEDSRQYMPEDMIAFMDLMRLEGDTPSMVMSDKDSRKEINMTLSEMLERARLFEQHLEKYPNEVSSEAAARLYEEIATNAISGGYNKTEGVEHYYKGESNDVIDQKALQYYQQFVEANPDSNLARVISEYINVLQTNDFKINENMEAFYQGLHGRFATSNLSTNGNNAGQSNSTGTSNVGNNNTQNNNSGNNNAGNNNKENSSVEGSSTEPSSVDGTNNTNGENNTDGINTASR